MPSEYDFLFPYSRRLRRAGSVLMAVGAFLAGAVCMAVIIALPLWSIGKDDTGADQGGEFASVERPRETTGLAAPNSTPADAGPAAPHTAPTAADLKPPVPATETGEPRGRIPALNVEKPADGERTAATNREAPGATHSGKSTEKPAATPDRRRARSTRTYASRTHARLARTSGDRRDGAREFVDAYGVRHIILPRRWSERAYDVPAMARPPRATRVIVVRPAPFDDD